MSKPRALTVTLPRGTREEMIGVRDIVAASLACAAFLGGAACGGSSGPNDGGSATSSSEGYSSSGLVLGASSSGLSVGSSSSRGTSSSRSSATASGSGSSGGTSSPASGSSGSSTVASSGASSGGTTSITSSSSVGSSSSGSSSSSANACGTLPVACSTYNCPPNSVCAGGGCSCKGNTLAIQCDGGFCPSTGCVAPGWWCAPLEPGPCGALNFDVGCSTDAGSYFCPANATCLGGGCTCNLGYSAETCGGAACSATVVCGYPEWWCAPPDAG